MRIASARRSPRQLGLGPCASDRRRCRGQSGLTMVEMMIGLSLMAMVMPIIGPMMLASLRSAGEAQVQSSGIDELRFAAGQIGRELRSAICVTEPAENATGSRLRFTTSANGTPYEVTYRVAADGTFRRQVTSESEAVIGQGLIEPDATFTQVANPRRSVALALVVQLEEERPKRLSSTIAGRNAWHTC